MSITGMWGRAEKPRSDEKRRPGLAGAAQFREERTFQGRAVRAGP